MPQNGPLEFILGCEKAPVELELLRGGLGRGAEVVVEGGAIGGPEHVLDLVVGGGEEGVLEGGGAGEGGHVLGAVEVGGFGGQA